MKTILSPGQRFIAALAAWIWLGAMMPALADFGSTQTVSPPDQTSTTAAATRSSPGPSGTASARLGAPGPSPLAVDGASAAAMGASAGQFDAGRVNLTTPAAPAITHTFALKNTTAQAVTVSRLYPSCGCTTVTADGQTVGGESNLSGKPNAAWKPVVLAPGVSMAVKVKVDLSKLPPGHLSKNVFVYTGGQNLPSAVLTITGEATTGVTASAGRLDLGAVKAGSAEPLSFTLTEDPSTAGKPLAVRASGAALIVKDIAAADGSGSTKTYQVSLAPDAPLGMLSAAIAVTDPTGKVHYATIPVAGRVTGALNASVEEIVFGAVRGSDPVTQTATLRGPAAGGQLTATCSSARLIAQVAGNRLSVTLSPGGKMGLFQGTVTVAAPDGTRLVLPVVADVVGG